MNKLILVGVVLSASVAGLYSRFEHVESKATSTPEAQTQAVVTATTAFLNSLSTEERQNVLFLFTPQQTATAATFKRAGMGGSGGPGGPPSMPRDTAGRGQGQAPNRGPGGGPGGPGDGPSGPRGGGGKGGFAGFVGEQYGSAVWSNFPVSDVPRPGLQIGKLSAAGRGAAMHLLTVLLSPKGYRKVLDIMGSDQALSEGGTNYSSGTAYYTIGIFGTPSTTTPWMVQFGGHHLGLNVVIAGPHGVLTPTLTGAQPAVYTKDGKTVRVLAQENDQAFDLLNALTQNQRKQAILTYQIGDLVLGPGQSGKTIVPEGLKASAMNASQRTMLLDLIGQWAGIINDAYVTARMSEIKAGLDETYFAWSGPTTHEPGRNGAAYYRIQGPKVIIEFSPQGVGGDLTMHIHTIYRDPTNDYGHTFTGR